MSESISFSGATTYTSATSGNFISTGIDVSSYISSGAVNANGAVSPASNSGRPLLLTSLSLGFASGTNSAGAGTFYARRNSSAHPSVSTPASYDAYESSSISDLDDNISRVMALPVYWTDVVYVGFIKSDTSTTRITAEYTGSESVVYQYSSGTSGTLASGYAQTSTLSFDEVPAAPTVTASDSTNGTLSVSWSTPSDGGSTITGYQVSYSSGGSWTHVNAGLTNSWSGSVSDGSYTVRVAAFNAVTNTFNTLYGWSGDTKMVGTAGTDTATITSSITITFDGQGGTPSFSSKDITPGTAIGTLPTISQGTYTFIGWFTSTNGGGTQISTSSTFSANDTLYAYWNSAVSFNSNGGSSVTTQYVPKGSTINPASYSSTRTGYTFDGWSPYNSTFTPTGATTLTAQWSALSVSWTDNSLTLTGRKGTAYSDTIAALYVNSWNDGILPSGGLSFSGGTNTTGSSTSTVSGTPTSYGDLTFTLTPYNADGFPGTSYTYTIDIKDVYPAWSDQVLTSSIATQDQSYTDGVSVASGPDVTYSVSFGSLPTGLSLNTSTGAITGTPTVPDTYEFKVTATNGSAESIETNLLTITVEAVGGYVKVWDGSAWADGTVYYYSGSQWVESTVKLYDGTSWNDSFSS